MEPLHQYIILFGMLVATAGLAWMIYLIKKSLGEKIDEPGKTMPAQSGNPSPEPAWNRYHVHYYGFALLFLAFDMEITKDLTHPKDGLLMNRSQAHFGPFHPGLPGGLSVFTELDGGYRH